MYLMVYGLVVSYYTCTIQNESVHPNASPLATLQEIMNIQYMNHEL